MFRITIHCVLLLTMVCGQVLSGVSCCCLAQSIAPSVAHAQAHPSQLKEVKRPACPKCAAVRLNAQPRARHVVKLTCEQIGAHGSNCDCAKALWTARQDSQQVAHSVTASTWVCTSYAQFSFKSAVALRVSAYQLPHVLDANSWQALACVWRI